MCKWFCTSEGPSTNLSCLHCHIHYCAACLHGEAGKMESLIKCAKCGKKPRTVENNNRGKWKGEANNNNNNISSSSSSSSTPSSASSSPTAPKKRTIFDKLTDTSLYTGAHKARFDSDGKGKGLDGRDSVPKGIGHKANPIIRGAGNGIVGGAGGGGGGGLSAINSPPKSTAISSSSSSSSSLTSSGRSKNTTTTTTNNNNNHKSIFDKLTDTSLYTGAHKNRFDSSGRGQGKAGRTDTTGGVHDLSQITRPGFR